MRMTAIKILGLVLLVTVFVFLPKQEVRAWGPPSCFDFVTFGGFYHGSSDGSGDVNFGGNAGYKNDSKVPLMAHINIEDHNLGRHIQIDNADIGYEVAANDPCHCRDIAGHAQVTVGGTTYTTTYTARVCDFGEPGNTRAGATTPDIFTIFLGDNSYHAGVPSSNLEGGNVQLHKNCQAGCDSN